MATAKRFPIHYDKSKVVSNSGERYDVVYSSYYDEDGILVVEPASKNDLYADIQTHRASVDINMILARYAAGETDVLSRVQGVYGDFADVPLDPHDILNLVHNAEDTFNHLPIEDKNRFGNDFARFLCSVDSPEFMRVFGLADVDETFEEVVDEKVEIDG